MKLVSLHDAIERFVPDGASIAMGTALEAMIPFAAGHELPVGLDDRGIVMPQGDRRLQVAGVHCRCEGGRERCGRACMHRRHDIRRPGTR